MSLRQENKARARASILEAAELLIATDGAAKTTTRAIAQQAGVSYQTLYNYFPTKAHIIQALMAEDLKAWADSIDTIIKQFSGDILSTLQLINRAGLQHFQGEKMDLWREIGAQLFQHQVGEQEFASLNQVAHERYYALLSMAQGMGQLRADVDLHLLAHTLFCLSDYAFLIVFLTDSGNDGTWLQTLDEQLALVVAPYLN
jgi:AcrR family transcriptional regulator